MLLGLYSVEVVLYSLCLCYYFFIYLHFFMTPMIFINHIIYFLRYHHSESDDLRLKLKVKACLKRVATLHATQLPLFLVGKLNSTP